MLQYGHCYFFCRKNDCRNRNTLVSGALRFANSTLRHFSCFIAGYAVTVSNGLVETVIITSDEHPFYVFSKGFTAASELKTNDQLVSLDYQILKVVSNKRIAQSMPMYNFEVADYHTYAVSEQNVWVHNDCINDLTRAALEGGRHNGQLKQFLKQTPDQLQKSIKSFDKQITKHTEWIKNPSSKVKNFDSLTDLHRRNIIHHWEQDIVSRPRRI